MSRRIASRHISKPQRHLVDLGRHILVAAHETLDCCAVPSIRETKPCFCNDSGSSERIWSCRFDRSAPLRLHPCLSRLPGCDPNTRWLAHRVVAEGQHGSGRLDVDRRPNARDRPVRLVARAAAADAAVKSIDAVLSLNELLPGASVKMVSRMIGRFFLLARHPTCKRAGVRSSGDSLNSSSPARASPKSDEQAAHAARRACCKLAAAEVLGKPRPAKISVLRYRKLAHCAIAPARRTTARDAGMPGRRTG